MNIYHNQKYMCIKVIMVFLLLLVPSIISCQKKNSSNYFATKETGDILETDASVL
jgi:hypothetical protein